MDWSERWEAHSTTREALFKEKEDGKWQTIIVRRAEPRRRKKRN